MRDKELFKKKKEELIHWIYKCGWTLDTFAEKVYTYMNDLDIDNEEDIKKFKEKFKKALQRDTTHIELMDIYLDILYEQPEFEKLGYIRPKNYFEGEFDTNFNSKMRKISQRITEELEVKSDNSN